MGVIIDEKNHVYKVFGTRDKEKDVYDHHVNLNVNNKPTTVSHLVTRGHNTNFSLAMLFFGSIGALGP